MATNPLILYDNRLADAGAVLTATDTASGYDVANLIDLRPYTFWLAASFGTKYIKVDCLTTKDADALGIVGHNLHTAGATVSVESSPNDSDWTERLAGFQPSDDSAIMKLFTSASARYWRIKIVTASIAPKIGVICLGERLTFERVMLAGYDPQPEQIVATAVASKAGHLLGADVRHLAVTLTPQWRVLSASWIDSTFRPAWDAHLSLLKPFFWAWDIDGHPGEVHFVRIPQNFKLAMPYIVGNPLYRKLALQFEGVKE